VSLRELLIHRISALATPAVELYENSQYLAGVVLTRAVMETVALTYSLHKQLLSFNESHDAKALDEFVMKSLHGSRWEDAAYQATNILTLVDHLDKTIPHFRGTYDSLSEYAHPNWSGVMGAFGRADKESYTLVLGQNQRTTILKSGLSSLCGALLTFHHFYNDMVDMLKIMNDYFEEKI
jgi:hypothetical protein